MAVEAGKGRLGEAVTHGEIVLENPGWVRRQVDWTRPYHGDRDRMRVALMLARWNAEQRTGGPFGAALFDDATGRLLAVGTNRVEPLGSVLLHAELVALALAERAHGAESLAQTSPVLYSSCEPCVLCTAAVLLSGVPRVVSSATAADAAAAGLDPHETPAALLEHAHASGVTFVREVLRDEARDVFALWRASRRPRP